MVESLVERNKNLPPTEAVKITTMAGCSPKNKKTKPKYGNKYNTRRYCNKSNGSSGKHRPFLNKDGGDIELIDVKKSVFVKLLGNCSVVLLIFQP
jgi:hypothetical protein